ncbi:hypothetical protein [Streptomyces virginiae]
MQYRAPVPLDDKRAAQKSTRHLDAGVQVNPVHAEQGYLSESDGYRPGTFRSDSFMDPEMQRHDGWRPSGSYSTSVHNDPTPGKYTNPHTRRMVMDDDTEYGHAVRRSTGDDRLYYRSGRAKLGVATVPAEFVEGAEAGREDPYGH